METHLAKNGYLANRNDFSFLLKIPGTKAATYVPSPTTNFLAGEGEEGTEVHQNNGVNNQLRPTEEQYAFGKLIQMAMERLFDSLQVQHRADHRIYEAEIIELSEEVNIILVLPPAQKLVQMSESDPENCLQLQGQYLVAFEFLSFYDFTKKN